MPHRRLTALLASLLLLPSTVVGGGKGCVMGGLIVVSSATAVVSGNRSAHAHGREARSPGHDAHRADSGAFVHEADTGAPLEVPHAPAECILAVGCGAGIIAAAVTPIDDPAHVAGRVEPGLVLAPDSPAPGLEPPPPRS